MSSPRAVMDDAFSRLLRAAGVRHRADAIPAPMWFGLGVGIVAMFFTACSWMASPGAGPRGGDSRDRETVATAPNPPSAETPAATPAPGPDRNYQSARLDGEPDIRVRIGEQRERLQITGPRRVLARLDADSQTPITVPAPVIVTIGEDAWRVRDAGGVEHLFPRTPDRREPPLRIESTDRAMLAVDNQPFPGTLRLHPRRDQSAGVFDVVEHVPVEQYLPGVIAKELYKDWSLETFKAQAIAARSYALQERGRRMALGAAFDVENTQADQVYGGMTDHSIAHRAVRDTAGVVLTWQGRILRAYYCSTVGGRAASARDTWPTTPGFEFNLDAPIQATPRDDSDRDSPLFRWTVRRDRAQLAERFRAYGAASNMLIRQIDGISKIEVFERNEFGRPRSFKVYDDMGRWYRLAAEEIRLACNHTDGKRLPAITREQRINSGDFEVTRERSAGGDVLVFTGRGFGHGVGMSQYGAQGMARRGMTANQILMHFYPGATLERAY